MTTFEAIMCLAATAAVIILAFGTLVMVKKLYHIAEQHKSTWAHFDNVVSQLYGIKTEVGQTNGKIDGFIPWAKHLRQKADNLENAWACDVTSIVKYIKELTDIVDKMHRNLCVEIADKMVNKMYPVNEGESLDAHFEPDYKLKKDIENKLNGFAAAMLDAECCPQEILDLWTERICESAHKFIEQFKIDWDKLSKEQQDEFLKRLIMPNYDSPFQPPFNPTCETKKNND